MSFPNIKGGMYNELITLFCQSNIQPSKIKERNILCFRLMSWQAYTGFHPDPLLTSFSYLPLMIYHINNCQICCQFVLKKKNLKLQLITRQFLQLSNVTKWELAISCSQKLKKKIFFLALSFLYLTALVVPKI